MARALVVAGLLLTPAWAWAGPPVSEAAVEQPERATVHGRLREAGGSRQPVVGATVMIVDAPAGVRPGKPAREPLDPAAIEWIHQVETDAEGRFTIPGVPLGKVRVVIVAGGYHRLEQWAEVGAESSPERPAIDLYLEPDRGGDYRTEVKTERPRIVAPTHVLDGQQARHYAGSGDDPMLAALNLPGAARTPGGFGLLSLRGGNPNETGVYLDGHPVPRAFHVLPIASVLSPPMTDRVELSPGNYGPGYGSFSAGLVEIYSRAGRGDAVHGEAHLDLFDLGTTLEAPVGPGAVHFGLRRSHVDAVLLGAERAIGDTGIMLPNYWDYLGRFDYPVHPGHVLTLRALGAGDRLRGRGVADGPELGVAANLFEFASAFHRFDLDYRLDKGPWRVLVSPSLRLDSSRLSQQQVIRRDAKVFSGRAQAEVRLSEWLRLEIGADLVSEHWERRERAPIVFGGDVVDDQQVGELEFDGQQARAGLWIAPAFRYRGWSFVPSLRMNLFAYPGQQIIRFDPRLDVRGEVHPKLTVFARIGRYSIPVALSSGGSSSNLISQNGGIFDGIADVPPYLIAFFDPGISGEIRDRSVSATSTIQASMGIEAALPWELELRGTLFWREVLPTAIPLMFTTGGGRDVYTSQRRSLGAELLLRRALGKHLDGWLGYTLMWAQQRPGNPELEVREWIPAIFDQRHNFVALLSTSLPRNFRFGMRFRLVSGNPESPVLAGEAVSTSFGNFYRPIRGDFGSTYQPMFHQLDLRLDKQWVRKRTSITAYLDVQNVYNRVYSEVPVYTRDWAQRASLIGLPIYPSLGVQVQF